MDQMTLILTCLKPPLASGLGSTGWRLPFHTAISCCVATCGSNQYLCHTGVGFSGSLLCASASTWALLPLQLIAGSDSFNDAELHEQNAIQAKAHTNCRAAQASCNADKGTHRAGRDITPSTGKHAKQLNMDKHADLRQDLAGMQGCGEPTAQHTPPGC